MTTGWWASRYTARASFYGRLRRHRLTDADTDGDGVLDGADDQDHDDIPNIMELAGNDGLGPAVRRGAH